MSKSILHSLVTDRVIALLSSSRTSKRSVRSIVKVTVQDYSILRLWRGLIPVRDWFRSIVSTVIFVVLVTGSSCSRQCYLLSIAQCVKRENPVDEFFSSTVHWTWQRFHSREKHQTVFVNGLYAAFARFTADLALFPSTFIKARLEVCVIIVSLTVQKRTKTKCYF